VVSAPCEGFFCGFSSWLGDHHDFCAIKVSQIQEYCSCDIRVQGCTAIGDRYNEVVVLGDVIIPRMPRVRGVGSMGVCGGASSSLPYSYICLRGYAVKQSRIVFWALDDISLIGSGVHVFVLSPRVRCAMRISIPTGNLFFLEADPDVCSFLMWVASVTPARQRLALESVVLNPRISSHFVTVNAAVMVRLSTSVLIRRGVWDVGGVY
jgi:hypothetical protein